VQEEDFSTFFIHRDLNLTANFFLNIILHEFNNVFQGPGVDTCARTNFKLLDGPLFVQFFRGYPHLLTENLSDFVTDESIVNPQRTCLCAFTAQSTPIGQFTKAGDKGPVEFNVASC